MHSAWEQTMSFHLRARQHLAPVEPTTLVGRFVSLVPLSPAHAPDLFACTPPDTFAYFSTVPPSHTPEGLEAYIRRLISDPGRLHFAVIDLSPGDTQGRAIGSTSYYDIRPSHLGLEIGFTWYGASARGTAVNPESKRLLLAHAFEALNAERVAFRTDARNQRSRRAIAKLGATEEGVLRHHLLMHDGAWRDTVYFSILRDEWPSVRASLDARLRALG
jgi:RimJ/RimL family protein N-acetyltransferase